MYADLSILKEFLFELRRRRVFRMTALYIVAAWAVVQVASEVFPAFNIPDAAIRHVWTAVLIDFPIAVFFSSRYDLTAAGIQRTPFAHEDPAADHSLKHVDYGVLAALGLILLVTVVDVGQRLVDIQTESARAPTTRAIDLYSIAVLPLENLSPSENDANFAAGVHEALIANLSGISALLVTSRKSNMNVDSALSVPAIGRQLGVAKLLEGSVLMDGDLVRIIVQLIDAASDLQL
jgi:TolB-like protein